MNTIEVHIHNEYEGEEDIPGEPLFQRCCNIANLSDHPVTSVSIAIVDAEEIQLLNQNYRKKNKPTNVLSFESKLPEAIAAEMNLLGDIILCPSVIQTEADDQQKSREAHWAHMVIHGMLHLQGYDHIEDDGAKQMEALEIKLLAQLGYPDPYTGA